jgi:hypothetical protein
LCLRQYISQKAALTPARQLVCSVFGINSRKWSAKLTDEQQDRWTMAGAQVLSHPRLVQKWSFCQEVAANVGGREPETRINSLQIVVSARKLGVNGGEEGPRRVTATLRPPSGHLVANR